MLRSVEDMFLCRGCLVWVNDCVIFLVNRKFLAQIFRNALVYSFVSTGLFSGRKVLGGGVRKAKVWSG